MLGSNYTDSRETFLTMGNCRIAEQSACLFSLTILLKIYLSQKQMLLSYLLNHQEGSHGFQRQTSHLHTDSVLTQDPASLCRNVHEILASQGTKVLPSPSEGARDPGECHPHWYSWAVFFLMLRGVLSYSASILQSPPQYTAHSQILLSRCPRQNIRYHFYCKSALVQGNSPFEGVLYYLWVIEKLVTQRRKSFLI